MSKQVIFRCDRCKTEYKKKHWIKLPRFGWGFAGVDYSFNHKVDLCSECWETAKGFFYGWLSGKIIIKK